MGFRPPLGAGILATSLLCVFSVFHPAVLLAQRTDRAEQRPFESSPYGILHDCGEPEFPFSGGLINTLSRDAKGVADETNCGVRSPQSSAQSLHSSHFSVSSATYSSCENCGAKAVPERGSVVPAVLPPIPPIKSASEKESHVILLARDRALGILRDDNACSAWFRESEPQAAEVFATLTYELDRKGQEFVTETRSDLIRLSQPWVARVVQAGGPYQIVTLNRHGAFFRSSAYLLIVSIEGGPALSRGARTLRVGPYIGGSQEAQLATILHEFGHTIGLLDFDGDDVAGKSIHNTDLVLAHCQAQIAAASKRAPLLSAD
jgi:hypothetical protein